MYIIKNQLNKYNPVYKVFVFTMPRMLLHGLKIVVAGHCRKREELWLRRETGSTQSDESLHVSDKVLHVSDKALHVSAKALHVSDNGRRLQF